MRVHMKRSIALLLIALCTMPIYAAPMPSKIAIPAALTDTEKIVARLTQLGCDPARIQTITSQLRADDARQLASHLEQLQSGGGMRKRIIIVAVVVIVVFLFALAAAQASLANNIG